MSFVFVWILFKNISEVNMIRYFSSRLNLQMLVAGLKGAALPAISQETL